MAAHCSFFPWRSSWGQWSFSAPRSRPPFYVAVVSLGGILLTGKLDGATTVLACVTVAAVFGVAHLQSRSWRQAINDARLAVERARNAQAVLKSFEASGNNLLWEVGMEGQLTYVSPKLA